MFYMQFTFTAICVERFANDAAEEKKSTTRHEMKWHEENQTEIPLNAMRFDSKLVFVSVCFFHVLTSLSFLVLQFALDFVCRLCFFFIMSEMWSIDGIECGIIGGIEIAHKFKIWVNFRSSLFWGHIGYVKIIGCRV